MIRGGRNLNKNKFNNIDDLVITTQSNIKLTEQSPDKIYDSVANSIEELGNNIPE